ncbi:MAG: ribonuclease III [Chitinophagaceae bacterium]|nr:MAG: ribonuclease III [Chitinophagaceae bacterium]
MENKKELKNVLGFTPRKTAIYEIALSHRSSKESKDENNERLEYLGDAILGAVIGDFLYKKYPYQPEGYLTEMRSKIVNRQRLNEIAIKMGLRRLTIYNKDNNFLKISGIFGNTLEALIGAVYLDQGFEKTRKFIFKRIVLPYIDLESLENEEINHKNKLYGWANKYGHQLEFELLDEHLEGGRRLFTVAIVVDGDMVCSGKAYNKKDAGQLAARDALDKLGIASGK